jgi:hypothetical protein
VQTDTPVVPDGCSVQLAGLNGPEPPALNVTVPVGVCAEPESVSITVAVQVAAMPTAIGLGAHVTAVDVLRAPTMIDVLASAGAWEPSPS